MKTLLYVLTISGLTIGTKLIEIAYDLGLRFLIRKTNLYKISKANINTVFTNKSRNEIDRLINESCKETLISLFESFYSWGHGPQKTSFHVNKIVDRYLYTQETVNNPRLCFSFHNRSIDFMLSWLIVQSQSTVMYKPFKLKLFDEFVKKHRSYKNSLPVEASISGVRQMLIDIKGNKSIILASDQVPQRKLGIESYFFGRKCYSTTIVSSLSKKMNNLPIMAYLTKPNKSIYSIVFTQCSHQIKLDEGHKYMNQLFEAEISKNPKEYSWEYKKFRRIEENKDLYNF
jgi:KDO2-lipid IV(A) lauroyltransferase